MPHVDYLLLPGPSRRRWYMLMLKYPVKEEDSTSPPLCALPANNTSHGGFSGKAGPWRAFGEGTSRSASILVTKTASTPTSGLRGGARRPPTGGGAWSGPRGWRAEVPAARSVGPGRGGRRRVQWRPALGRGRRGPAPLARSPAAAPSPPAAWLALSLGDMGGARKLLPRPFRSHPQAPFLATALSG